MKVEMYMEDEGPAYKSKKRMAKYIASITSNIIFFFIINLYPLWITKTNGVVTNNWISVLWAMDLAIITLVVGYVVLLAYSPKWLRALVEFFIAVTALVSTVVFLIVFPIDFSALVGMWLNTLLKVFLIIGIVGTSIGALVSLVKFVRAMIIVCKG